MTILKYLKALSDETRIRLINILMNYELSVSEIVSITNMGQSRISRHLRVLVDAGLLTYRRDGVLVFYSIVSDGSAIIFVESIKKMFAEDDLLIVDLARAVQIINERKHKTMIFFNSIAGEWDFLKRKILGTYDLTSEIMKLIENGSALVDLGCGTGDLLFHLKNKSNRVIGVDSSPKMLDEARKRFKNEHDHIDLRLGELEHLPLRDKETDCAVASMVLHHLSNPQALISEVSRILKPGGVFIIADFEKHGLENMRKTYGDRWLGFTSNELEQWLINYGFSIILKQSSELHQSLVLNLFKLIKK